MKFQSFFVSACIACIGIFSAYGQIGIKPQPQTLTLQEAVRLALARSPEVLLAETQSLRALHALREARSLNLPQVSAGTGYAYTNGYPLSVGGSGPSIFEVVATQSIFSKTNKNLIREAEENGKASKLGAEAVRNEIASRTALVYYTLHQAKKISLLISERLDLARKQQAQVETLLDAGRVRPFDATMAGTAVKSLEHQLLIFHEQEKNSEFEMLELTGLSDKTSIRTVEPQIDSPIFNMQEETLFQKALESDPKVSQAETIIRAKEFHIEASKGENFPRIEAASQYSLFSRSNNYEDYFRRFSRHNFVLGLSLQIPLFDGFRTKAKVAESREEATEARYRLQSIKSDLKKNIRNESSALRVAQDAVELARYEVKAAQENLQVNEALLDSGRISSQQLEELRSTLRQKELALLDSDLELFQRKISLLRVAGIIASAF
jgi:outer membrane protein TolC